MLMVAGGHLGGKSRPRWWSERVTPLPCPADFDAVFVEIGRLGCQEHYGVGRPTINSWLEERGKQRLIDARAAKVGPLSKNWRGERPATLTRKEVGKIIARAIPVEDHRRVSPIEAQKAARFLREVRNGGWIVSPTGQGDWRVGTRRVSPAQLVDLARAKGFDPASLTVGGDGGVGSGNVR